MSTTLSPKAVAWWEFSAFEQGQEQAYADAYVAGRVPFKSAAELAITAGYTPEGSRLLAKWRAASDVVPSLPLTIRQTAHALIQQGGAELQKSRPSLTEAQATVAFAGTKVGKALRAAGDSVSELARPGDKAAGARARGTLMDSLGAFRDGEISKALTSEPLVARFFLAVPGK